MTNAARRKVARILEHRQEEIEHEEAGHEDQYTTDTGHDAIDDQRMHPRRCTDQSQHCIDPVCDRPSDHTINPVQKGRRHVDHQAKNHIHNGEKDGQPKPAMGNDIVDAVGCRQTVIRRAMYDLAHQAIDVAVAAIGD